MRVPAGLIIEGLRPGQGALARCVDALQRISAIIDGSAGSVEEMARIIARIRQRWPGVRILLRADSGFAREALMAWCEDNAVDFLFGLAR